MIRLHDQDNGAAIGDITERQLQFLVEQLEEESTTDRDYYVDAHTLDMFRDAGADPDLVELLERALGQREGITIRWSKS
jgi:processive 1,2-diacylglycerol beta-glucosyltransferase